MLYLQKQIQVNIRIFSKSFTVYNICEARGREWTAQILCWPRLLPSWVESAEWPGPVYDAQRQGMTLTEALVVVS